MAGATDISPRAHNYSFKTKRLLFQPLRLDNAAAVFALKSNPSSLLLDASPLVDCQITRLILTREAFTKKPQADEWIQARVESEHC